MGVSRVAAYHQHMIPALRDITVKRRYAIYWAPPRDHPLWQAGCKWLGRDPEQPATTPPSSAWAALTAAPRRYGFHATLKAPMALREPHDQAAFLAAVSALASRHAAFEMPRLQVGRLGRFIALRAVGEPGPGHPMRRLADDCVTALDPWRAPVTETDMARRLGGLSPDPALEDRLRHWGYPHVFDHWRFHMTLSDTITDPASAAALIVGAERHFAPALRVPLRCQELCVFVENAPGADFLLLQRLPLQSDGMAIGSCAGGCQPPHASTQTRP